MIIAPDIVIATDSLQRHDDEHDDDMPEKKPGSLSPARGIGHVRPTQSPSKRDY
jgi:hypothetical protein